MKFPTTQTPLVSIPSRGSGKGDLERDHHGYRRGWPRTHSVSIPSRGSGKGDWWATSRSCHTTWATTFQSPLGEVVKETAVTKVTGQNPEVSIPSRGSGKGDFRLG